MPSFGWVKEIKKASKLLPPFLYVVLVPLLKPLPYLMYLYTSLEPEANSFHKNIRGYNSLLA